MASPGADQLFDGTEAEKLTTRQLIGSPRAAAVGTVQTRLHIKDGARIAGQIQVYSGGCRSTFSYLRRGLVIKSLSRASVLFTPSICLVTLMVG